MAGCQYQATIERFAGHATPQGVTEKQGYHPIFLY